jgi:hypothetical protein
MIDKQDLSVLEEEAKQLSLRAIELDRVLRGGYMNQKANGPVISQNYAVSREEPRMIGIVIHCPVRFPSINLVWNRGKTVDYRVYRDLRKWWTDQINSALATLSPKILQPRFKKAHIIVLAGSTVDVDNYGIKSIVDAVHHQVLLGDEPIHLQGISIFGNKIHDRRIVILVIEDCPEIEEIANRYSAMLVNDI